MFRLFGLLSFLAWAAALALLVSRDIAPYWATTDPPSTVLPPGDHQVGIFDATGRRVGTAWVIVHTQRDALAIESTTALENLAPLPGLMALPSMLIESSLTLSRPDERLLGFEVELVQPGASLAAVEGTRIGDDFACQARFGAHLREFSLDADASTLLSESLRPFSHLPDLRIGQTWRIRVLDIVTLLRDRSAAFASRPVRVTGRESIEHAGRTVECFRIETEGATAWADDSGRVLVQKVQLPLLGAWEMRAEPFQFMTRQSARQSFLRNVRGEPVYKRHL